MDVLWNQNATASRLTGAVLGFAFLLGFAPSAEAALAFGPPAPVNADAATDAASDRRPSIATDGQSWVAVWETRNRFGSDTDVVFARSVDGGRTWSLPAPIDASENEDSRGHRDEAPSVVASRNGTFLVIWVSFDPAGPDRPTGCLVARSTDGGATWGAPVGVVGTNWNEATIATDGAGVWVVATRTGLAELTTVRSEDDGLTWREPITHGMLAGVRTPQVASDGRNWLVTFPDLRPLENALPTSGDWDIYAIRSTDGGRTWSPSFALDPGAAGDDRPDGGEVRVTASSGGTWVIIWQRSSEQPDPLLPDDDEIAVSRSIDGGATWAPFSILNADAPQDRKSDVPSHLATDGRGFWVALWDDAGFPSRGIPLGRPLLAESSDDGLTWGVPRRLHGSDALLDPHEKDPHAATDGLGEWVVSWTGEASRSGSIGDDGDVLAMRTETLAPPSGCATRSCTLEQSLANGACADIATPRNILQKLHRAENLLAKAAGTSGKKATKRARAARQVIAEAMALARRLAKGRRPKLPPTCAAHLTEVAQALRQGQCLPCD